MHKAVWISEANGTSTCVRKGSNNLTVMTEDPDTWTSSLHYAEPKGSLSWSQEPATNLYPEPDEFSPYTIL
jgi:hypothetical protein